MRNSTQYQYFPFVECLLELATEDSQQKEQANADQQPGVSKKLGSPRLVRHSQNENQNENLELRGVQPRV